MSDALTWTVNALLGREISVPKSVADLPHRVYQKK